MLLGNIDQFHKICYIDEKNFLILFFLDKVPVI